MSKHPCACQMDSTKSIDPDTMLGYAIEAMERVFTRCTAGDQSRHEGRLLARAQHLTTFARMRLSLRDDRIAATLRDATSDVRICGLEKPWGNEATRFMWIEKALSEALEAGE